MAGLTPDIKHKGMEKLGQILGQTMFQTGIKGLAVVEDELPVTITFEEKDIAEKTFNKLSKKSTKESRAAALEARANTRAMRPMSVTRSTYLVGNVPHSNENLIKGLSLNDFYDVFEIEAESSGINAMALPGPTEGSTAALGITEARNLSFVDSISVWLPYSTVTSLIDPDSAKFDDIKLIDLDFKVKAFMEQEESHLGVPPLWNGDPKYNGEDIVVGVLDTGIFAAESVNGITGTHPDFEGKILGMKDFTGSDPKGTLTDATSHCTHVVGSICGSGKISGGRFRGIAPESKAYVAKVLKIDANGDGTGLESWIVDAIQWAVKSNVDVINMSLGGPQPNNGQDLLSQAVNNAVDEGIVVCVAAGNWGPKTIDTPGSAKAAITIGSTNLQDKLSRFSSTGPIQADYNKPDVVAPGENIISTLAQGFRYFYPQFSDKPSLPPDLQGFYTFKSGTSMATPIVAGIVCLMLDAHFKKYGKQNRRSKELVAKIKEALTSTTKDIGLGPDEEGRGVVQPAKAIAKLISNVGPITPPSVEMSFNYEQLAKMLKVMNNNFQNLPVGAMQLDGQLRSLISLLLGNKKSIEQITPQVMDLWNRYNQIVQPSTETTGAGSG